MICTFKAIHYCLQMYLKILQINALEFMKLILLTFYAHQACLKNTGVKLELLTDNDMLMMIEKGIKDGICHGIYRYAKANNKYMKNYNRNIELSCLMYLDANNLYGWPMFQKLPADCFKWKKMFKFDEEFTKSMI